MLLRDRYLHDRHQPWYALLDTQMRDDDIVACPTTLTDPDTGLMWSVETSASSLDWYAALAWQDAQNTRALLGHDDWRLPNACELAGFKAHFPTQPAATTAAIRTIQSCGTPSGTQPDTVSLRSTTHETFFDSPLNSGIEAARGTTELRRGAVRGDDVRLIGPTIDSGQFSLPAQCTAQAMRVYDRIPLVRDENG